MISYLPIDLPCPSTKVLSILPLCLTNPINLLLWCGLKVSFSPFNLPLLKMGGHFSQY